MNEQEDKKIWCATTLHFICIYIMRYKRERTTICYNYRSFSLSLLNCGCYITKCRLHMQISIFVFCLYFAGRTSGQSRKVQIKKCIVVVCFFYDRYLASEFRSTRTRCCQRADKKAEDFELNGRKHYLNLIGS
jgi:hypothetical protein